MPVRLLLPLLVVSGLACAPSRAATQTNPTTVAAAPARAPADISKEEYAARRAALARLVRDGVVFAFASVEPEADYLEFHQNPNFYYLTGITEPDAVLVMTVRGGVGEPLLFVHDRNPAIEVWSGTRLGFERAAAITGMRARTLREFLHVADSLTPSGARVYTIGSSDVPDVFVDNVEQFAQRLAGRNAVILGGNSLVAQLRARKSDQEIALVRHAVDVTVAAHAAVARTVAPGRYEYEVEAALEHVFRTAGAERAGFASIVGSGPNSTTLHYNRNDRQMRDGEVVVVDIGASWRGYAGDVTRTYPVNGRFTADQRAIYQIVRDAQAAAERVGTPGTPAIEMNRAATRVIAEGLARLGLIEAPDAMYDCGSGQCRQVGLYYMHGLGHAIGLDVHDPGTSSVQPGQLAVNDVFSIEPGIYVRRNLLDIIRDTPRNGAFKARIAANVARYADIGVRIEDDYLVTGRGLEWISRFPREAGEIESLVTSR